MGRALSNDRRSQVLKVACEGLSARSAGIHSEYPPQLRSAGLSALGMVNWKHARWVDIVSQGLTRMRVSLWA